jgi:hypothetical protein
MNYKKAVLFSSVLIIALLASFLPFSGGAVAVPSGGSPPTGSTSVLNDIEWHPGGVLGLGELATLVINAEVGIGKRAGSQDERYQILDGRDADFSPLLYGGTGWGYYTNSIAFGDVDGDGLDEIGITRNADENLRYRIRDDAENNFIELHAEGKGDWAGGTSATCIAFGDVDGDGLDEVGITRNADENWRYEILDDADHGFSVLYGNGEDEGGRKWGDDFYATCIAFGDVDGDGLDEVGITRNADENLRFKIRDDAENNFIELHAEGKGVWAGGTSATCIAFGDVDGDGCDEVGITSSADEGLRYKILDDAENNFIELHAEGKGDWAADTRATWIAFGDVDCDGRDEVGVTRIGFGEWKCRIYNDAGSEFEKLRDWGDGWGSDTYATCIAFGDVDFDGVDEIGITRARPNKGVPSYWILDDRNNDFGQLFEGGRNDTDYATCIAFGDVDGGSLTVGEPRHSVQTIDNQIVAVINAPPKQSGVNFEYGKYTATYKSSVQDQVIESVKATTGFAFTTSFKASAGVENIAKASFELESKVGKKWERESETTYTTTITDTYVADMQDICLALETCYDVYEYKVLSPPDEAIKNGEPQYIVLTIPQAAPKQTDHVWDGGNHVLGDIRTYPSTTSQLLRYIPDQLILDWENTIDGYEIHKSRCGKNETSLKEKDTSSLKLSMKMGYSVGSKVSGAQFSTAGEYESEDIVTHATTLTEEICIGVDYVGGLTDSWKYYMVQPVLYYDNEFGYLVLDYVVTDVGKYYQFLALWDIIRGDQEALEAALESDWWHNTWQSSLGTTVVVVPDWVSSCSTIPMPIQIPIRIENAEDIESMAITLPYDPDILSPTEVSKGTLTAQSSLEWDIGDGTIQIALEDSAGINGNGSIATIGFEVVGSLGDYYTLAPTVSANGGTSQEDESIAVRSGLFLVKSMEEMRGDCDGNGDIDSVDALLALKMSEGKIEVNLVGDMNEDDEVTPSDAAEMLSMGARKAVTDFYCRLQGIDKGIKPRTET